MADPPQRTPTRTAPPKIATQSKPRVADRSAVRTDPLAIPRTDSATAMAAEKLPGLQMEEAIRTAGGAGEQNITIGWFWVALDGHLPAGFNVATLADHGLDVTMEQLQYRKTYTGTGALKTGLTPIVPIGTKGRLIVKDTTTGEAVEQPWTWKSRGGGFGLWQLIKRLLWKG